MAARFLVTGGTGNWNSTSNWSATTGGASGASFPTAADDVTLDVNSGATPITVNVASAALTVTATAGYTGILTMTNTLTVSGSVTFIAGMGTIAGTGALIVGVAATITSGGKIIPALTLQGGVTITFGDNWTVSGPVALGNGANTTTLAGAFTLNVGGNLTIGAGGTGAIITPSGGLSIVLNGTAGTQTISSSLTTGSFRVNLEINTSGSIVAFSGNIRYQGGVLKYTAGTVTSTGSTFTLSAAATITANALGLNFATLAIFASQTINGTSGFTMVNLQILGVNVAMTLTITTLLVYSVTGSLVITGTNAAHILLTSSSGVAFKLNYSGSTLALAYCDATNVDSSGGSPIYTYQGVAGVGNGDTNWTTGTVIGAGGGRGMLYQPGMSGGMDG